MRARAQTWRSSARRCGRQDRAKLPPQCGRHSRRYGLCVAPSSDFDGIRTKTTEDTEAHGGTSFKNLRLKSTSLGLLAAQREACAGGAGDYFATIVEYV